MTDNAVVIKGRIINKHDTEANWNKAVNFAPLLGETIVYDPDSTHSRPRYKVGIWDGKSEKTADMLIMNLPFANEPDTILEDDLANLFTKAKAARSYATFNIHLIDTETNSLAVVSIRYIANTTTWGEIVAEYPEYFTLSTTEWDKTTGRPYVKFAAPYHGQDFVMKRVTPVDPADPVTVPCTTTDIVDPTRLRATYVCSESSECPICQAYNN
jgi:hypothetical protein